MADKRLSLRCQTKHGRHAVEGLTLNSTVEHLLEKIQELTKIPACSQKIFQGYPPKETDVTNPNTKLSTLPFRSGDTLIVEEAPCGKIASNLVTKTDNSEVIIQRRLTRISVPADNSCLFTSVSFLMEAPEISTGRARDLRHLIARIVSSDPVKYNSAFLGKDTHDYSAWILSDETWGGAIEISILSKVYSVEIAVADIQTVRVDRFGEAMNYKKRIILIYDGIHYDPLAMETGDPEEPLQRVFSTQDDTVLAKAMEIAESARLMKHYTNLSNFKMRCIVCNTGLTGPAEATLHASKTGHTNFGEI
ncbi:ubiquitin thioesterase OTU1-like [Saccoglossus kowalevskii]|uniref:Ubiquitin thioesterase OTU n=1 Tax=Saccoglossus kowalevskii TaxID=10224 RepID=A0ABM0GY49_SACKO|nr:PREDICTED: ubiquitin thioesterase OTU1-like [Saccoglossus kowalevskii]